ncbi:MAG: glycoside hydrolase family 2 protein [Blautia marasmi]
MLYIHDENIDNIWLRLDDMRNLAFEKSPVICTADHQEDSDRTLTVHSEAFAHGVHIKGNYKCSDNYFDLLPGKQKHSPSKMPGKPHWNLHL